MSVTCYFSIAFSNALAQGDAETKKNALAKLQGYFDARPEINTGDETYHPASYAISPFLDGTKDLSGVFKTKVLHAELNAQQNTEVQELGFSTRDVGPQAFIFYKTSSDPEAHIS